MQRRQHLLFIKHSNNSYRHPSETRPLSEFLLIRRQLFQILFIPNHLSDPVFRCRFEDSYTIIVCDLMTVVFQ